MTVRAVRVVPNVAGYRFNNELRRRTETADEQVHLTPEYVLDPVRRVLGGSIGLDPCTTPENPVGANDLLRFPKTVRRTLGQPVRCSATRRTAKQGSGGYEDASRPATRA